MSSEALTPPVNPVRLRVFCAYGQNRDGNGDSPRLESPFYDLANRGSRVGVLGPPELVELSPSNRQTKWSGPRASTTPYLSRKTLALISPLLWVHGEDNIPSQYSFETPCHCTVDSTRRHPNKGKDCEASGTDSVGVGPGTHGRTLWCEP